MSVTSCPPPPLLKLLSPHPRPPPVLLAAVGVALAPPWVDVVLWLGLVSPPVLAVEDGVDMSVRFLIRYRGGLTQVDLVRM